MKEYKEVVRFEEILPASDFLLEELDKIRGGIETTTADCFTGVVCKPSGKVKLAQVGGQVISAI